MRRSLATALTLALALSYGGREEIAHAAQELARDVATGKLDPEAIDEPGRFRDDVAAAFDELVS